MNLKPLTLVLGLSTALCATQPLPSALISTSEPRTASVAAGSQLVFAPVSGPSRLTLTQLQNGDLRITVLTETTLTVTPDPSGLASYREWTLVAGTELTLAAGDLDLTTTRTIKSTTIFVNLTGGTVGLVHSSQSAAMGATTSTNLTMDPDPGSGRP